MSSTEPVSFNLSGTNLFKPLKVGNIELKHRAALAALTRNRTDEDGSLILDLAKEYYSQRSKREGTLIVSEGLAVNDLHKIGGFLELILPGMTFPQLSTDSHEAKWREVIETVHNNNSFIFLQLAAIKLSADPVASLSSFTKDQFKAIADDFIKSADRAFNAGADGVEIHACNGSILYQLLNPDINQRNDEYGGSIENRVRLPLEIIDAIGSKHGYSKVSVRVSPFYRVNPQDPVSPFIIPQISYFVAELEKRRQNGDELAYVSVIEARANFYHENERTDWSNESSNFVPSIYNGVIFRSSNFIHDQKEAKEALQNGKAILGFGRYFISNPDLPDRLENGSVLNPYQRPTFYTKSAEGYVDYPTVGSELPNVKDLKV